jgi:uncharacterized protein (DUF342 family)
MCQHGLKITFLFVCLSLLALGLSAQEVLPPNSTLTPKEQALQLLDNLEQNNNEAESYSIQSVEELQTVLNEKSELKGSLKKTALYSDSLEKSLNLSQTINKVAVPVTIVAIVTAVLIAIFK